MKTKPKTTGRQAKPPVRQSKPAAGRKTVEENVLAQMVNIAGGITADVPAQAWDKLPRDLSKNVDHYLFGQPKRDEE